MGKPGFPISLPVGVPAAPNSGWDMGKPGFPNPLPAGRVWEGCALPKTPHFHRGVARPANRAFLAIPFSAGIPSESYERRASCPQVPSVCRCA